MSDERAVDKDAFREALAPLVRVAARGALESSVAASWLNEPDIARDDRVKRGLSEFLYSAVEEERLDLHPDAAAHVDEWVDRATKLGWAATDRTQRRHVDPQQSRQAVR